MTQAVLTTDYPARWFAQDLSRNGYPLEGPVYVAEAGRVYEVAGIQLAYEGMAEVVTPDGRVGRVYASQIHDTPESAWADVRKWQAKKAEAAAAATATAPTDDNPDTNGHPAPTVAPAPAIGQERRVYWWANGPVVKPVHVLEQQPDRTLIRLATQPHDAGFYVDSRSIHDSGKAAYQDVLRYREAQRQSAGGRR